MDIRVGAVARVGPPPAKPAAGIDVVEAKVLAIRPPRSSSQNVPNGRVDQRRGGSPAQDPPGARVLVLMVVDGARVPKDLQTRDYRVFLRFARR